MMLDAETQDFLDQLSARGPAQPQATLGEAWRTSWEAAGLTTVGGVRAPRAQALDELATAYRTASGGDPYEEARRRGIPLEAADDEQRAATIAMLARGLPEGAQQQLAPHLDVNAKAAAIAARTEREAADTAARTWGLSGNAAMVMAGMARTMVDPTTLAVTAGVAAATPETGGLAAFLAREAFINAGATAATQPFVNAERAGLGLEPAPLLESIAESAVAGAALGGLFRGAGVAARRMFGRGDIGIPAAEGGAPKDLASRSGPAQPLDAMPPAVREAAGHFEPEDFDLAARHLDNRAVEDLQALRPDALGAAEHAQAIDAVAASIDRGGPLAADALPEATPDREALMASIDSRARELSPRIFARADELDAQIAQARAEIQRVQERPVPETVLAGRIAAIEADLSQITGKRRSSPRAKELRAELEGLAAEREALIAQQARVNQEQLGLLRENLVAMENERGNLGPKVRAVRAHAAGQVSPDRAETSQALRAAAARDAATPVSRKETAPESVITQNAELTAPAVRPSRPLSDYPLRDVEPPAPKSSAAAEPSATKSSNSGSLQKIENSQTPPPAATPELAALRASAERAIVEAGDAPFHFTDEATGEARMVAPSALLREIDEEAVAARELEACLAGVIEEAAPQ
jgi:hypothetical protein